MGVVRKATDTNLDRDVAIVPTLQELVAVDRRRTGNASGSSPPSRLLPRLLGRPDRLVY